MGDLATAVHGDQFSASLTVEGAHIHISAPSFDLLGSLLARFRGLPADAPATTEVVKAHNAKQPKETKAAASAGVSADEKQAAAAAGNVSPSPSPQAAAPSAAPAAAPSAATSQVAASAGEVTQDMVNKATIALSKVEGGTDKAKAIFAELGVGRASEISAKCPENLPVAYAELTAALGG